MHCMHSCSNFSALENLGALDIHRIFVGRMIRMEDFWFRTLKSMVLKAPVTYVSPSSSTCVLRPRPVWVWSKGLYSTGYGMPYVNFETYPLMSTSTRNKTAPIATDLSLDMQRELITAVKLQLQLLSRVCFGLEELQSKAGKPYVKLTSQPWA
jgi:hypothetical protein